MSAEEKERILNMIETDREFRYALMGLLGYREVLERIARVEERIAKIEERFVELAERVAKIEEELRDLGRVMSAIAHRFGMLTEEGFREAMKYVVEEVLGAAKVSRWVYYDSRGAVYRRPSIVEADIVVRNGEHILIEIKSRVDKGDLVELYEIGKLYEEVNNVKPRLVVLGAFFAKGVKELAEELGIELKPIAKTYS